MKTRTDSTGSYGPCTKGHSMTTARNRLVAVGLLIGVLAVSACGSKYDLEEVLASENQGRSAITEHAGAVSSGGEVGSGQPDLTGTTVAPGGDAPSGATTSPGAGPSGTPASGGDAPAAAGCTSQGAPVVIGQVGGFSGLVGSAVNGTTQGLAVWARDVNARGGLACHPVQVISRDDGSDPAKSQAAVNDLVSKNAIALVSAQHPVNVAGYRAAVEAKQIAAIGGDQVQDVWEQSAFFFPVGSTNDGLFAGAVSAAVDAGFDKVATLYCVESTACSALNRVVQEQQGAIGYTSVYSATVSLTQTDFTAACQNAKNAGATAIAFGADAAALQRLARNCETLGGYKPAFIITGLQAGFDKADPLLRRNGVFASSPVAPASSDAQAGFRKAVQTYAPSSPSNTASAHAYTSGLMLEAAVNRLGDSARGSLTREMVLQALRTVSDEDLGGLIPKVTYRNGPQPENKCFYPLAFGASGEITAPRGNQAVCL